MQERWLQTGKRALALRLIGGYALLSIMAFALAVALREGPPWVHPEPWFAWPSPLGHVASAALGLGFSTTLIGMTRYLVARFGWARRLHVELRPVARDLSIGQILLVAGLSSLGEELLFRGLLTPTVGVVISALLFGLAHQIKGPSRWVWAGWAMTVGLGLGAIFAATGSLVGPLLCHALVNAANLVFLRDHDPLESAV
ncbi:MAG: type II CAAX endopeptidase family protein [Minicystis sp.]